MKKNNILNIKKTIDCNTAGLQAFLAFMKSTNSFVEHLKLFYFNNSYAKIKMFKPW